MSELTQQAWANANETRAQRLKEWRGNLTTEERLAQLEERFLTEDDRLWHVEFPEYDEKLTEINHRIANTCNRLYGEVSAETAALKIQAEQTLKEITETVDKLIASSGHEVVTKALIAALKSTVLKTRPATREESKGGGDVLVVRQATREEIHTQS